MRGVLFSILVVFVIRSQVYAQSLSVFEEKGGLLTIEAENLDFNAPWQLANSVDGASGQGYIYWSGNDYFDEPGQGLIDIPIQINTAGTYTFLWRTKVGRGTSPTEHNDTWVKCESAAAFYAEREDGHRLYPLGSGQEPEPEGAGAEGWFKVYSSWTTHWTWVCNTSDNDGHGIKLKFDKPGRYLLQLSARSRLHYLDKIELILDQKVNNIELLKNGVKQSGELKTWHPLTLSFDGPESTETATPNPFIDYCLDVTFTHEDGRTYKVPGYYAVCGTAADSSCTTGNQWRVIFSPDRRGKWQWKASFLEGKGVAVGNAGKPSPFIHGLTGNFQIADSDKSGRDHRRADRGRLQYAGEHYLRYAGTNPDQPNGPWLIKAGADAPENVFDYNDFDGTPNRGYRQKNWNPHARDFSPGDATAYTWQGGKGANLLGVMKYLSEAGMNAFSLISFTASGDDENVFPHLLRVSDSLYQTFDRSQQWDEGIYHDRMDCSKLDQWNRIFSYADKKGVYIHFKLGEEENETKMDGGELGRERKLYYRELIARFGHHLALNWNLGEENGAPVEPYMTTAQRIAAANYFKENDPYQHHRVIHTRPDKQKEIYTPLLGENSAFTGASLQTVDLPVTHEQVKYWVGTSAQSDKKWVVANDEQGTYQHGVGMDDDFSGQRPAEKHQPDNRAEVRQEVLWGTLLGGGAGVEYYYGYETGCGDLGCQDQRTRATKWEDARLALNFFNQYLQGDLIEMKNLDEATPRTDDFVFGIEEKTYVVYVPDGQETAIDLPKGKWKVQWYNPRSEMDLTKEEKIENSSIQSPTNNDWVAIIRK